MKTSHLKLSGHILSPFGLIWSIFMVFLTCLDHKNNMTNGLQVAGLVSLGLVCEIVWWERPATLPDGSLFKVQNSPSSAHCWCFETKLCWETHSAKSRSVSLRNPQGATRLAEVSGRATPQSVLIKTTVVCLSGTSAFFKGPPSEAAP